MSAATPAAMLPPPSGCSRSAASGGNQRGHLAEVVLGDQVRAATSRVRVDRLAIGKHHDREDAGDDECDRARERERRGAREHQHPQVLLGRVHNRRERVGRQHGQARDPGEPFVVREMRGDRLADDESLETRKQSFFGHGDLPRADGVS